MISWECDSFAEAYEKPLKHLFDNPAYVTSPRNQKINEECNVVITIKNPHLNLFENEERSVPSKYLANELILYFTGDNRAESFKKASTFWGIIANEDGTVNSAYGHLLFKMRDAAGGMTQWEWAVNSLKKDKDSRQAIMHYNRPIHQFEVNKDFCCTMSNQFFIRNNKLNMTTYIRSNDIFFGWTFDCPFFMLLMQCMILELKDIYPDLEMGEYTHFAGSFHMYERNFEVLKKMLDYEFKKKKLPILKENPIMHPEIFKMRDEEDYEYTGSDEFLKWLDFNRR